MSDRNPTIPKNDPRIRHGQSTRQRKSPTYMSWQAMLVRCLRPYHVAYPRYGGAGITVCEKWRDFKAFYADVGDRPIGTSIDRIDNTKGYEPGNVRWATPVEQMRNIKTARFVTFRGKKTTVSEVAELSGITASLLRARLRNGWSLERAVSEKKHERHRIPVRADDTAAQLRALIRVSK